MLPLNRKGGERMNKIELEKTTNEIKGVAGMLLMMSEVPEGIYKWGEWAHYNLFLRLEVCIEKLEAIVDKKFEDEEE